MKLSPICQTLMHSKSNPLSPVIQNMKKHSIHSIENEKGEPQSVRIKDQSIGGRKQKVNLQLNDKIKENEQLRGQIMEQEIQINKLKGIEHELFLVKEMSDIRFQDYQKSKQQAEQLYQELTDIQAVFQDSSTKLINQAEEIQTWKIRYAELDSARLQQLQELKQQIYKKQEDDDQKQSYLKAITDLERTIQSLQNQLQEKEDSLRLANEDINQWKIKFSKVQIQQKQVVNDKEKDQKYRCQQMKLKDQMIYWVKEMMKFIHQRDWLKNCLTYFDQLKSIKIGQRSKIQMKFLIYSRFITYVYIQLS